MFADMDSSIVFVFVMYIVFVIWCILILALKQLRICFCFIVNVWTYASSINYWIHREVLNNEIYTCFLFEGSYSEAVDVVHKAVRDKDLRWSGGGIVVPLKHHVLIISKEYMSNEEIDRFYTIYKEYGTFCNCKFCRSSKYRMVEYEIEKEVKNLNRISLLIFYSFYLFQRNEKYYYFKRMVPFIKHEMEKVREYSWQQKLKKERLLSEKKRLEKMVSEERRLLKLQKQREKQKKRLQKIERIQNAARIKMLDLQFKRKRKKARKQRQKKIKEEKKKIKEVKRIKQEEWKKRQEGERRKEKNQNKSWNQHYQRQETNLTKIKILTGREKLIVEQEERKTFMKEINVLQNILIQRGRRRLRVASYCKNEWFLYTRKHILFDKNLKNRNECVAKYIEKIL